VKRLKKEQNYIYIYNYKTNSMEHSPYWEAKMSSASQ
jgi:hypothetical protein